MKLNLLSYLALFVALNATVFASPATDRNTVCRYLPDNELWREDFLEAASNINQNEFNQIVKAGYEAYAPSAEARGEELIIDSRWEDPTVNAYASRKNDLDKGKMVVTISMFGGLARRSEVNMEGFALVLCHELSHAYGGEPFARRDVEISAEGQADYIAAKICLGKILPRIASSSDDLRTIENGSLKYICDRLVTRNTFEHSLCQRKFSAGLSLGNFLSHSLKQIEPLYNTPDPFVAEQTLVSYPRTVQCRLDTYAAGFIGWQRPSCWFRGGSKNNPISDNFSY